MLGAGAVGLLCAAASKVAGAKHVVIADILEDRVKFAVENGFADAALTVPIPTVRPETVEDKLAYAQSVAESLKNLKAKDGQEVIGESAVTFECTGVESCMQTAIYVMPLYFPYWSPSTFSPYANKVTNRQHNPAARS